MFHFDLVFPHPFCGVHCPAFGAIVLAEGPPEGCVAGSLLSDVLLCLASTV